MIVLNEDECLAAGLDPKEVKKLASRLDRLARDAAKLGLTVFGSTNSGSLRFPDPKGDLIVAAATGGNWDAGCGAEKIDEDGLIRGE